jgi:hypothetical protein
MILVSKERHRRAYLRLILLAFVRLAAAKKSLTGTRKPLANSS